MDLNARIIFNLQKSLINDIFQLECEVLKSGTDLTAERAKLIQADLDSCYEDFVENQLELMQDTEQIGELSDIMNIGKTVQNKMIYLKTKLNNVSDTQPGQNLLEALTDDDLIDFNSMLKKENRPIERIESLIDADESEVPEICLMPENDQKQRSDKKESPVRNSSCGVGVDEKLPKDNQLCANAGMYANDDDIKSDPTEVSLVTAGFLIFTFVIGNYINNYIQKTLFG